MDAQRIEYLLLSLPVLLFSLTAHEFAHAWVALRQGDDTAYMLGRVSMNPAAHLDPIGSLLFPAIAILSNLPLLGWAKPVPTNPRKYRNYVRGDVLVSIAGVVANAILAVAFAILVIVIMRSVPDPRAMSGPVDTVVRMCLYGVMGNVGLILFNLLPIPPLDGSHVLYHLLPADWAAEYRKLYPFGMIILWGMVLLGLFRFLGPAIYGIVNFLIFPSGIRL